MENAKATDNESSEATDSKKTNENKPKGSLLKNKGVEHPRTRIAVTDKRKSKPISEGDTLRKFNGGCGLVLKPKPRKNLTSTIFNVVNRSKASEKVECLSLDQTVKHDSKVSPDLSASTKTFSSADKIKDLNMPSNVSSSSLEEELPHYGDECFGISVLPGKYHAHLGMKFLPSPKKKIATPFQFDGKEKPFLRRSKTELTGLASASSTTCRRVNVNTSCLRSKDLHQEETKRKTGTKLKSIKSDSSLREHRPKSNKPNLSLEQKKLAKVTDTVLEKAQETLSKYNAYSGLVLKPKSHKNVTSPTFNVVELSKAIKKVECQSLDQTVKHDLKISSDLSASTRTFSSVDKIEDPIMPRNVSSSSMEDELSQYGDGYTETSVLPSEYQGHSGVKFLPSPKKKMATPFKFDGKEKPVLRRSKTELTDLASASSTISVRVNVDTSQASRPLSENLHQEETKRKTGTKLQSRKSNHPLEEKKLKSMKSDSSLREHRPKSNKPDPSLEQQNLAKLADTVLEEAQILPKKFAGHSGLTFKLKPSSRSKRNSTFHIKPKE